MRRREFILLCSIAAGLPACGFRLRGASTVPALKSAVALEHEDAPLLADYLLRRPGSLRFMRAGVDGAGPIQLNINAEDFRRSAASFSPQTGRAVEYRLEYSVQARADYGDGRELMQPQRIHAYEDYLLDDANVGDRARIENLRQELLRRVAEDVHRRLSAALRLAR